MSWRRESEEEDGDEITWDCGYKNSSLLLFLVRGSAVPAAAKCLAGGCPSRAPSSRSPTQGALSHGAERGRV